ncbi:MAG: helix-turn-helix transcriptional regulator, partial [Actinomycetes bacterium]
QGPSFMQGVLLAWSDDLAGARARLVATRERALHLGDEASEPLILRHLAHLELLAGNLTTAARLVEQGLAVADETGQLSQRAVLLGVRAMVDAVGGDEVRARGSAEESIALSTSSGAMFGWALAQGALGMLDLSLGDAEQAYVHLGPLVGHLDAAGVQEPGAVRADADAIECLIRLGRTDEAARGLERLEERATRIGRPSALANAARCRGLLAAQDDLPRAIAHLQRGLALHGRAAFPVDRARTLLALGSTLRRMRRWREARAALDTAAIELESLGAPLWLARAVDERGRIGGRAPSPGGLTPTESRIAGLVAQGRSNREVAASLFITVKTVEANLTRIYAKLGVSSRTALAHRLAESAAPSGPAVHHGGSPDSGQPSAL